MQSDTWELKDGRWSPVDCIERPPARHRGAMVFDEERGVTVLFGGQSQFMWMLGDTWTFANGSWQRLRLSWWRRPGPRCGHAMAFDKTTRQVVLFGGIGTWKGTLGDTWTFDGSCWTRIRGEHPPARRYASFAYDPRLQGCILHGGAVDDRGAQKFGDTWLFRDGNWEPFPETFDTDTRDDHGLAFHRSAKTMVMLEGIGAPRGLLVASPSGWERARCAPLHPQHQCSPLAWDDSLNGLVLHGGERYHAGPQFDATMVLRIA
ncbi:Kelch repeat-containing protein [Singulisphaera sp. PoT]|uniref:Kelch repeat-containing protein n=1 Tax=Singulisphaera sp. PoT TaxID=3411797 RepID=UPI003BF462EB